MNEDIDQSPNPDATQELRRVGGEKGFDNRVPGRGRLFVTCPRCGAMNPRNAGTCYADGADLSGVVARTTRAGELRMKPDPVADRPSPVSAGVGATDAPTEEIPRIDAPAADASPASPRPRRTRAGLWAGFAAVSMVLAMTPWLRGQQADDASMRIVADEAAAEMAAQLPATPMEDSEVPAEPAAGVAATAEREIVAWGIPPVDRARLAMLSEEDAPDDEPDLLAGMAAPESRPAPKVAAESRLVALEGEDQPPAGLAVLADASSRDIPEKIPSGGGETLRREIVKLLASHGLRGFKVSVSADNVVTLKGACASSRKKRKALALVRQNAGVARVRDKIFVYQPTRQKLLSLN